MEYTYVARQPILNRRQQTLGYELLFRDGEENSFPAYISSDRATYRLISENFMVIGKNPVLGTSRCFINFSQNSLLRGLPLSLPKRSIVVEILETCEPTDELFRAIRELYRNGYLLALDDFVYRPEWERFLPYIHIIKLDIEAWGIEKACRFVQERLTDKSKCRFLAERVETEEQFRLAKQAGFVFFQGFFFKRPEIIKQKYVEPKHVTAMALFREVVQDDIDFDKVERIITKDVTLSYKLLNFVNAMSKTDIVMNSFKQALVYLGQDNLKIFVSLTAASFLCSNKPRELFHLALQRAQFCQLMSTFPVFQPVKEQAFVIGLFSVLDALLDSPIDSVVEQLPLTKSVKQALVYREGSLGALLNVQEHFEKADWKGIEMESRKLKLSVDEVSSYLHDALYWSQSYQQVA